MHRTLLLHACLMASTLPVLGGMKEPPAADRAAGMAPDNGNAVQPLIILDPGHGGEDLGAVVARKMEKDISLAVSKKVRARIEQLGGTVRMTRDADVFVPLDRRIETTSGVKEAVFVSIHANDTRNKHLSGMTLYAYGKSGRSWHKTRRSSRLISLPSPPREMRRESASFAAALTQSLRTEGLRVEWPAKAEYYVLKNPEHPSVLLELGYLSNPKDLARLVDPAYQQHLADAVAKGLLQYIARMPHAPRLASTVTLAVGTK